MGLFDALGNPNCTLATRITRKEKKYLDDYKGKQEDEPTYTQILRIALIEFLERNLDKEQQPSK